MTVIRLDIGCGARCTPGYTPVDIQDGVPAYPLAAKDGTIDEIRASHVLEHFGHRQVADVLADWVRALKPGGLLRVAVPNFEKIARLYLEGKKIPVQGYVMGGQVDDHDRHGAIFDSGSLTDALRAAGLIGITQWTSEQQDCAALPISLNLQGNKPPSEWPKTHAVLSVPRLGWNDMWGCTFEALGSLGICITKHTGAYWEQCITRAMDEALRTNPDYILALDYDTVFSRHDVQSLLCAVMRSQADAVAAVQVHRTKPTPLLTIGDGNGGNAAQVPYETFAGELTRCRTAHFGLTLIRAAKLRALPQPWFHGLPDEGGEWGEQRTDPDISFWRNWEQAGNSLFVANRVPVGHLEVMIRWPGSDMHAIWQHPSDYQTHGAPEGIWQ